MKKQWKFLLYTTAVLCMSVSCKKDPISELRPDLDCEDGTCCSSTVGVRYQFIAEFKDEPITFSRGVLAGIGFKNLIAGKRIAGWACEFSYPIIKNWETTAPEPFSGQLPAYKHRISGKIFLK